MSTIAGSKDSKMKQAERIALFLTDVPKSKIVSTGTSGLKPYLKTGAEDGVYTANEANKLVKLGIEDRMRVKISDHYESLVTGFSGMPPSQPLRALVTAREEEVADLSGEADPSNQLRYSPASGILHKYEMALLYVVKTCSAHCRYCYRLDLFSGKTGKPIAREEEVVDYIREYNAQVEESGDGPALREVLLSGGDPMVLANSKLASWLAHLAENGIRQIRIGSKELAFRPQRFDKAFFAMLDRFHEFYPDVRLVFAVHFTHPDEFLRRDRRGDYLEGKGGCGVWIDDVAEAVEQLTRRRHFVSLENQTPIIRRVNDHPATIARLQREMYRKGIGNHYFFQCRRIEGHKAFAVPVERTLRIFNESQQGLSGVESHARLVMSTERGKMEIVGQVGDQMIFRLLRDPRGTELKGAVAIAGSNPEAFWIHDYQDRVLADPQDILS